LIEFEALTTNLVIDANVFKACIANGVKKVVFASSIAVYPVETQNSRYDVVMKEDSLDCYNPEGGYGWGKLLGEIELGMASGLKIGIARIYNMYGENSHVGHQQHVVVDLMQKAIEYPKKPFDVWGDGRQSRDFLHVSDCAAALMKLEEHASVKPVIVNVGAGKAVTIKELAERIVKISGKDIKISYDLTKPVGPLSRTSSIEKAKEVLNWEPKIGLDEGLTRTYKWLEKRLDA
jgi:GDP-D-mannose 3',5'-epimerase